MPAYLRYVNKEFQSKKQMASHIIFLIKSEMKVFLNDQLKVYGVKNTILRLHCAKVWHLKKRGVHMSNLQALFSLYGLL